jgi:hypothetical protein
MVDDLQTPTAKLLGHAIEDNAVAAAAVSYVATFATEIAGKR